MSQPLYDKILYELEEIKAEFMDEEDLISEYCDDHVIEEIILELNSKYRININLDWLKIYDMKVDEFIKYVITLIETK